MHFFPFYCVLCPNKFRFTRIWAFQWYSWSIRAHRMWRHIIRWLEPDVSRQCIGLQDLKFMVISTLENEATYFFAKSGTRHPMTHRHRDLKSKFDQFNVQGSVHRKYILIYIQQDATLHNLFISGNCSTCFGWYLHPSSGAHTTVSTVSPAIVEELELLAVPTPPR